MSDFQQNLALKALQDALIDQSSNAFTLISLVEKIAEFEIQWQTKSQCI
ncbi:hypothetical protein SynA1562_02649 [Synechococcus sp. A15-62]|nr:hypothetical protein SynA1562_02649 [Synechococcus sp. A15-62]